ncbi:MAG: ATP-grasp fold amidoligase family protein [Patescibacteria group bacterium]|nr:ATP-grasp fold amidoligase family protein [Patescibacteria group bacterium]
MNTTDRQYIEKRYLEAFGKPINLDNPRTISEKLNWLKLNDTPRWWLVDKYEVRRFVANAVGEERLIRLHGVWNSVDAIDVTTLPRQFVLKPTHGSGWVVIVAENATHDWGASRSRLREWMQTNYYTRGREPVYRDIVPRIVAEEYLGDVPDYKLMCFHGEPKLLYVLSGRFGAKRITFYDLQWNKLPLSVGIAPPSEEYIPCPDLERMAFIARRLARGIPFVRVDFYQHGDRVLFGEMTFFPGNGFIPHEPAEWEYVLGDYLQL